MINMINVDIMKDRARMFNMFHKFCSPRSYHIIKNCVLNV